MRWLAPSDGGDVTAKRHLCLLRRCHRDASAQKTACLNVPCDVPLSDDACFAGQAVIPLVNGAALQRIALILRRINLDSVVAPGIGPGRTGFPAAGDEALVGLAAVAVGHLIPVARLRLGRGAWRSRQRAARTCQSGQKNCQGKLAPRKKAGGHTGLSGVTGPAGPEMHPASANVATPANSSFEQVMVTPLG